MSTKSLQIGFIGLVLSIATAWAGPSAIQGVVKDAKGQVIKGADVRIESRDGKKLFKTVKTDVNGRYVSDGLAAGVYRVTLVVNGAVKASIMNTKTKSDQPTQLNFDLKPVSALQASAADLAASAANSYERLRTISGKSDRVWRLCVGPPIPIDG